MNNSDFTINADEVLKMFSEFDARKRKSVYRSAINRGLGIVKKQASANLKSVIDSSKFNQIDKYGNSFKKGIKTKVYKDAKGGVIHIMSNFKVKFFELGTKSRRTKTWRGKALKKSRRTGSIKATHFFRGQQKFNGDSHIAQQF